MRNPWNLLLARHLANSYDILFRQEQLTQSKYAFVSSNDNRNLRKYIIDFIVKITNAFSNRVTSEHSTTLLKFIYIVWATPKRFFLTIRREIMKLKPNQSLQVIKRKRPPARRTRDHKNIVFCSRAPYRLASFNSISSLKGQ